MRRTLTPYSSEQYPETDRYIHRGVRLVATFAHNCRLDYKLIVLLSIIAFLNFVIIQVLKVSITLYMVCTYLTAAAVDTPVDKQKTGDVVYTISSSCRDGCTMTVLCALFILSATGNWWEKPAPPTTEIGGKRLRAHAHTVSFGAQLPVTA